MKKQSILFDLDGTLLDTAPDIAYILNRVRENYQLPPLPLSTIRPAVNEGVKGLLQLAGDITDTHPDFEQMVNECFALYQEHLTSATRLFPQMDSVLEFAESHHMPWGIVTNKPSRFTFDILKTLDLETRAACIICGDTLTKSKPHPDPILYACQLLQQTPADCVYVGDSYVDVTASKAAGTATLVALYGYIKPNDDPFTWNADGYIREPGDIIEWLRQS